MAQSFSANPAIIIETAFCLVLGVEAVDELVGQARSKWDQKVMDKFLEVFPESNEADLEDTLEQAAVCTACPFMDCWQPERSVVHHIFGEIGNKILQGRGERFFPVGQTETNPLAAKAVYATLRKHLAAFTEETDERLEREFVDQETRQRWCLNMRDQTFSLLQRLVMRLCSGTSQLRLRLLAGSLADDTVNVSRAQFTVLVASQGNAPLVTPVGKAVEDQIVWENAAFQIPVPTLDEQITLELVSSSMIKKKRTVGQCTLELAQFASGEREVWLNIFDDAGAVTGRLRVAAELVVHASLSAPDSTLMPLCDPIRAYRLFDGLLCLLVRRNVQSGGSPFLDTVCIAMLQQFCLMHGLGLPLLYLTYLRRLAALVAGGVKVDLASTTRLINALRTVLMHPSTPALTQSELRLELTAQLVLCKNAREIVLRSDSWGRAVEPASTVLLWGWAARARQEPRRAPPQQEETFDTAMKRCRMVFLQQCSQEVAQEDLEQAARACAWRAPLSDGQWSVCISIGSLVDDLVTCRSPDIRARAPLLAYSLSVTLGHEFIRDVALPLLRRLAGDPDPGVRCAISCTAGCVLYTAVVAVMDPASLEGVSNVLRRMSTDADLTVRQAAAESLAPMMTSTHDDGPLLSDLVQDVFRVLATDPVVPVRRAVLRQAPALCAQPLPPHATTMRALVGLVQEALAGLAEADPSAWEGADVELRLIADSVYTLLQHLGSERWNEAEALVDAFARCRHSEVRCALADSLGRWPFTDAERDSIAAGDSGLALAVPFVRAADRLMRDSAADVRTAGLLAAPRLLPLAPRKVRDSWIGAVTEVYAAVNVTFVREFAPVAASVACCIPAVLHYGGVPVWVSALRNAHATLRSSVDPSTRKALAASLHEVARLLGPQLAEQDILPALHDALHDPDENVRIAVMKNMMLVSQHLSPHAAAAVLGIWGTPNSTLWTTRRLRELRAVLAPGIISASAALDESTAATLVPFFVCTLVASREVCVQQEALRSMPRLYQLLSPQLRLKLIDSVLELAGPPQGAPFMLCTFVHAVRALAGCLSDPADCEKMVSVLRQIVSPPPGVRGSRVAGEHARALLEQLERGSAASEAMLETPHEFQRLSMTDDCPMTEVSDQDSSSGTAVGAGMGHSTVAVVVP